MELRKEMDRPQGQLVERRRIGTFNVRLLPAEAQQLRYGEKETHTSQELIVELGMALPQDTSSCQPTGRVQAARDVQVHGQRRKNRRHVLLQIG